MKPWRKRTSEIQEESPIIQIGEDVKISMLESDPNILGDLYKNCKDVKEKIRYAALYAVSRGNDVRTIADIIAVEESTV